jgi:hypothetical protein
MVRRNGHIAQFEVVGDIVSVTSPLGHKETQQGELPAEVVAGMLLGELIAEAHRKS